MVPDWDKCSVKKSSCQIDLTAAQTVDKPYIFLNLKVTVDLRSRPLRFPAGGP